MPWHQAQGIVLRDRGQDQLRLHHGEGSTNALARSSSKGKIGEARTASRPFWREAFQVEHVRLLPKCRVTVGTIGTEKHHTLGYNRIAAHLIGGYGKARETEGRGIEPHRFL